MVKGNDMDAFVPQRGCDMNARQIQMLLQRSKTTGHLLQLQALIRKAALDHDEYCTSNFILSACPISVDLARLIFDSSPIKPPLFAWNTIIKHYSKSSKPVKSINLFSQLKSNSPVEALMAFLDMKLGNEKPNSVTLVSILSACTRLLDIRLGESIHSFTVVNDIGLDVILGTALLEMYAKCGHIQKALHIFNSMGEKNLQSWTVMISGLADNGNGEAAISLFTKMEEGGLKPDGMSFSGILSACSHLGLVVEGQK
ncbi:hypothetical protein RJ639_041260 [Escallonia herrerae]|uniref:Pentatricopeptide repeat-containing protein n=1 Tax=Escallonia herrerae TaxID=1293975 RepID=A0AA88WI34_9ASTE|nr:hypothetical protein RJ639_041260 [Escallonia herrerae]